MKKCFKCGLEKDLSEFYKHNQMKDGHLNKCKECTRCDSIKNRNKNIDYYRSYDRTRGSRQSKGYTSEYRKKYPNKYRAHCMINNAIRNGKLFRESCQECDMEENTHAHHDDYLKPLNVRWLCPICHSKWHKENGEAKNAR